MSIRRSQPPLGPGAIPRRLVLKGLTGAGLAAGLGGVGACLRTTPATSDVIREENERAGSSEWLLSKPAPIWEHGSRSPRIEGYCSRTSVRSGDTLEIMLSARPRSSVVIDFYRLGHYGGTGGRHLLRAGPFQPRRQPLPDEGEERLRECLWEPTTRITVPEDWLSGVYLGKLTVERSGFQSYIIFIVCDDRRCDFLFQCSDATWLAYNRWPSEWSMYDSVDVKGWYSGPGIRASWDRPYGAYPDYVNAPRTQGSGEFLLWEFPMAYWLEREGYDVSYISNVDTHRDGPGLLRSKAFLSIGHDEYWSLEMFENVRAAVAAGVNAAFFSGNTCWGVIPFLPNSRGSADRVITRTGQFGPVDPRALPYYPELALFQDNPPSEATLIGARSIFPYIGYADWTCVAEHSWIFSGTGMKDGDSIRGLVGWEFMGEPAAIPGLEVVASGSVHGLGVEEAYTATLYPGARDNFVFNAATCWWPLGLAKPPGFVRPARGPIGPDRRAQRITANLLDAFRASRGAA